VCKQVTVCSGHIWTTFYNLQIYVNFQIKWELHFFVFPLNENSEWLEGPISSQYYKLPEGNFFVISSRSILEEFL
jgi:hypothetical protein